MSRIHLLLGGLVAAPTAAQCLEVLADSRHALGFRLVGFRDVLAQPVVARLRGHGDFAAQAGWPSELMQHWGEIAPALPLGAPATKVGEATPWQLPDPSSRAFDELNAAQRRAVRRMWDCGITRGLTVRVARPFGRTGCVTWFAPEPRPVEDGALAGAMPLLTRTFFASFDRVNGLGRPASLTEREMECLRWAARGLTDKEIARAMERSVDTVRFHMKSIVRKLGTANRTHAVAVCVHAGLIRPE